MKYNSLKVSKIRSEDLKNSQLTGPGIDLVENCFCGIFAAIETLTEP